MDEAVAKLRAFVEAHPHGQLLVETIPAAKLRDAAEGVDEGAPFVAMHRHKAGRWLKESRARARGKSSFDHFLARYGTLTWVVHPDLDARGFLCGNLSGGGWGVLELGASFNKAAHLDRVAKIPELAGHGFDRAILFHGGWGNGGYIMDGRVTSPDGEHPIYPYEDDQPAAGIPHASKLRPQMKVEPFGVWLLRKVNALIKDLRPKLDAFEAKRKQIAAERRADAQVRPPAKAVTIEELSRLAKASLGELYRDPATGELWGVNDYKALVAVHDGQALIRNHRMRAGPATLKKLAAADKDETRGIRSASFRSTRVRSDGDLFVSIEALGPLLVVFRGWNNGLAHEERRRLATPQAALDAAKALDQRYSRSFKPVTTKVGPKPLIRELWDLSGPGIGYTSVKGRTGAALEAALLALRDGKHHLKILEW